jgi:hypothetical protein
MKKIIVLLILFLANPIMLLAFNKTKYHHVRTNKRAWSKSLCTDVDNSIVAPDIYVSEDSVLIYINDFINDLKVSITDYLHANKEVIGQNYNWLYSQTEERIYIADLPEGIYKVNLYQISSNDSLFGYFAIGEQYEHEVEILGIPTLTVVNKSKNIIHDTKGCKIPLSSIRKGDIYIIDRKKVLYH